MCVRWRIGLVSLRLSNQPDPQSLAFKRSTWFKIMRTVTDRSPSTLRAWPQWSAPSGAWGTVNSAAVKIVNRAVGYAGSCKRRPGRTSAHPTGIPFSIWRAETSPSCRIALPCARIIANGMKLLCIESHRSAIPFSSLSFRHIHSNWVCVCCFKNITLNWIHSFWTEGEIRRPDGLSLSAYATFHCPKRLVPSQTQSPPRYGSLHFRLHSFGFGPADRLWRYTLCNVRFPVQTQRCTQRHWD